MGAKVREIVDGIPVLLVEAAEPGGELVPWVSHLGGSAEQTPRCSSGSPERGIRPAGQRPRRRPG